MDALVFEGWNRDVNIALRQGNIVLVAGKRYQPVKRDTIRADKGIVYGLRIGQLVITTSGIGMILHLSQSNYLPRVKIQLDTRIKWFGKTKILGIEKES